MNQRTSVRNDSYRSISPDGASTGRTSLPQCDIKASYSSESDDPRPRIRGTGKLLSNVHDVGLALMRLEHVELADKCLLKFQVEIDSEGENKLLDLTHWWPSWWPGRETDALKRGQN